MSFVDKVTSSRGENIRKFNFIDSDGVKKFCYFEINKAKQQEFLKKLADKAIVKLTDYGKILGKCEGEKPNESLIQFMIDKYGFKREELEI